MIFSARLFADDLLNIERTRTPGPDRQGHHQFAFDLESYIYLTPDEADRVADHFRRLADNLRKEIAP